MSGENSREEIQIENYARMIKQLEEAIGNVLYATYLAFQIEDKYMQLKLEDAVQELEEIKNIIKEKVSYMLKDRKTKIPQNLLFYLS